MRIRSIFVRTVALATLIAVGVVVAVLVRGGRDGVRAAPPPTPGSAQPAAVRARAGCPGAGPSKPVPVAFPKSFPLPHGLRVVHVKRYSAQGIPPVLYLEGTMPLGLGDAATFFTSEVPRRGYHLTLGDSEAGLEAESRFIGKGVTGLWKVRAFRGCSRESAVVVGIVLPG